MKLMAKGNRNRAVRHTEMNINSSRSHAILQIAIEQVGLVPSVMASKDLLGRLLV
jgi:hypothetical protein